MCMYIFLFMEFDMALSLDIDVTTLVDGNLDSSLDDNLDLNTNIEDSIEVCESTETEISEETMPIMDVVNVDDFRINRFVDFFTLENQEIVDIEEENLENQESLSLDTQPVEEIISNNGESEDLNSTEEVSLYA